MSAAELKERLRADLKAAMRERKSGEMSVIRTLIAAIDNAEAVPIDGLAERLRLREDIGEVARADLDSGALERILSHEIETRLSAEQDYQDHGRAGDAAQLRSEATFVSRYRA
jgi:uncharacterized protein YqeY